MQSCGPPEIEFDTNVLHNYAPRKTFLKHEFIVDKY